ncbi:hypothetical protein Pla123a_46730 [Posidoniimonas polymericola]|uniref:Uncharacterized protein n=1 Tax=Posidoniimonas polymericola TaxID=2528002 RepID=A0A5C5XUV3_9BACT|nr:hypothetical protein [Posidoniimonas polymericola]TWT66279.1 hypothetical protein Pla123a_46730 [Posidoniimonas polymericola]
MNPKQFSLRQLLLLTTALCPLLALPGGPLALFVVFCWAILVGVFVAAFTLVYGQLYVTIAGRRWGEEAGRRSAHATGPSQQEP